MLFSFGITKKRGNENRKIKFRLAKLSPKGKEWSNKKKMATVILFYNRLVLIQ